MYTKILFLIALAAAATFPGLALAQPAPFPSKHITFVVPWPPGGAADILSRVIGEQLGQRLGQAVVVVNKPGAGGLIGTEFAAKSSPDGYTLLLGSTGPNAIAPSLYRGLRYDALRDLTPVTQITELPLVMLVQKESPYISVKDVLGAGKRGERLNFGSVGVGTAQHLTSEIFKARSNLEALHIAYKGSAPAFAGLIGGEVSFVFDNIPASQALIAGGRVRALAISSKARSPVLADVPTMAEAGVLDFDVVAWQNILVPAGTPEAIVNRLNREIVQIINMPAMKERIAGMGATVVGNTAAQEKARLAFEVGQWKEAVDRAGVKLDY